MYHKQIVQYFFPDGKHEDKIMRRLPFTGREVAQNTGFQSLIILVYMSTWELKRNYL